MSDYAARLPLLGGALCLDFTTTLEPWRAEQPKEFPLCPADVALPGQTMATLELGTGL